MGTVGGDIPENNRSPYNVSVKRSLWCICLVVLFVVDAEQAASCRNLLRNDLLDSVATLSHNLATIFTGGDPRCAADGQVSLDAADPSDCASATEGEGSQRSSNGSEFADDLYIVDFSGPGVDGDLGLLSDDTRPLIFWQLQNACAPNGLRVVKDVAQDSVLLSHGNDCPCGACCDLPAGVRRRDGGYLRDRGGKLSRRQFGLHRHTSRRAQRPPTAHAAPPRAARTASRPVFAPERTSVTGVCARQRRRRAPGQAHAVTRWPGCSDGVLPFRCFGIYMGHSACTTSESIAIERRSTWLRSRCGSSRDFEEANDLTGTTAAIIAARGPVRAPPRPAALTSGCRA